LVLIPREVNTASSIILKGTLGYTLKSLNLCSVLFSKPFFNFIVQETNLHNPLVLLAAVEAIVGLLIEISFIATFTQRFFGR